ALLGVLNPGISYSLALLGLVTVTASTAALMWAAEPLLIVALAALMLREPVTFRLAAIIAGGLVGVVMVAGALSGAQLGMGEIAGTLLILLAVACCALYTVLSRRLTATADPVATAMVQQVAGLLGCLAVLALGPFGGWPDLVVLPIDLLIYAMLSGLLYYAIAYGLFLSALRVTPAGIASGYYNLIPVFGVALAYVFLGERLSGTQAVGAAFILISALFLMRLTARSSQG
ncbi:MAG: DMT family transporter, partial [Alphaproteobacteria bacterium]|nr:DMT family transporter [Alphaproteobacteria bacterium]